MGSLQIIKYGMKTGNPPLIHTFKTQGAALILYSTGAGTEVNKERQVYIYDRNHRGDGGGSRKAHRTDGRCQNHTESRYGIPLRKIMRQKGSRCALRYRKSKCWYLRTDPCRSLPN